MSRKPVIPVNHFGDNNLSGVTLERFSFADLPALGDWEQPERHDRYSFFLVEAGTVSLDIDFKTYHIAAPALIFMHPDQVHRMLGFEAVTVCAWALCDEQLDANYRQLLEELSPQRPLALDAIAIERFQAAIAAAMQMGASETEPLRIPLFRAQVNGLTGLLISAYLKHSQHKENDNRAEVITRTFRTTLAANFKNWKKPSDYAKKLRLSPSYLNECLKAVTGQPVSWHIQQRVILEAKRLLAHSDQSLKEIAAELGFDDYAYFSRLFRKVTGATPRQFKNRD